MKLREISKMEELALLEGDAWTKLNITDLRGICFWLPTTSRLRQAIIAEIWDFNTAINHSLEYNQKKKYLHKKNNLNKWTK